MPGKEIIVQSILINLTLAYFIPAIPGSNEIGRRAVEEKPANWQRGAAKFITDWLLVITRIIENIFLRLLVQHKYCFIF